MAGTSWDAAPWVESPWFEEELARRQLPAEVEGWARSLRDDGFAVLRGAVPVDLVEAVRDEVAGRLHGVGRVQDAWRTCETVRELALFDPILDALRLLYGRQPVPFQTLDFEYGTQQRAHSDVVHFSSLPPRFMCGVWVALEPVDAGNGPLHYYPGSHRLADPAFQHYGLDHGFASYAAYEDVQQALVDAAGLTAVEFHAEPGDALIWSANLVHGGLPIRDAGRTRWSQVTHYFFDGCVYVTPLLSNPDVGAWHVRWPLVDIATGEEARQTLNGRPVTFEEIGDGQSIVRLQATGERVPAADPRLVEANRRIDELQAAVDGLKASTSYRLGHTLLRPVAAARHWATRHRRTV